MTCSAPGDCKEIERRHTNGSGLLVDGGTSRGNLLSGGAEEVILTVSRIKAERKANPGYRAFLSNGHNVTRAVALFIGEIVIEVWAAARQRRRDVKPRGHRGGTYPFLRAAMCVFLRDLIVFSVISDMLRGRPAVYATLSGYDEVAHHSGLERHDTLETLRKLDKQLGTNCPGRPTGSAPLRDRRPLRSRPDSGRDVQAAQRVRARRPRSPLDRGAAGAIAPRRRRERNGRRARVRGGARRRAGADDEWRREESGRPGSRRARIGEPRPHLPDGGAASPDARGDRGSTSTTRALRSASIRTSDSSSSTPRNTGRSCSELRARTTFGRTAWKARIRSAPSRRTQLSISRVPVDSSMPRTCS